jgi:hypothetical protein
VITAPGDELGQTARRSAGGPNLNACLSPDVKGIKQALREAFVPQSQTSESLSIDPLVGTWSGTVENNGYKMQMTVTIEEGCQREQLCGRFDISTVGCSGTLTWVGMDGDLYQFQAGDKTAACGEGIDYLSPQSDGSVLYISRGDYGETRGVLQRAP